MTPGPEDHAAQIGLAYDRYATGLYRYAVMMLGDRAAAADAVQQVFAAWLRQTHAIDEDERYLRRAVRNECYSALRRRQREPLSTAPFLEPIDPASAHTEEQVAIEQALRVLPAEQREVVHLKIFEGMTFQEIADATGESINTAASRYRYAIEKLRAHLHVRR